MNLNLSPIIVSTETCYEDHSLFSMLDQIYDLKTSPKFNRLLGDIPRTIIIGRVYNEFLKLIPNEIKDKIIFIDNVTSNDFFELVKEFSQSIKFIIQTEEFVRNSEQNDLIAGNSLAFRKEFQWLSSFCQKNNCVYIKQVKTIKSINISQKLISSANSLLPMANTVYEVHGDRSKNTLTFKNTKNRSGQLTDFNVEITKIK